MSRAKPMIQVTVLGATGSIGTSTLDVLSRHPEQYAVFALCANTSVEKMVKLCHQHQPKYAVMTDSTASKQLARVLKDSTTQVLSGEQGVCEVVSHPETDCVVAAIVGAAGLVSTLRAVETGKRVLLANKEALVMAGQLMITAADKSGAQLLPIDSEHNAIFQCLPQNAYGVSLQGVNNILLTASGGPFRNFSMQELQRVTAEQALLHPNWSMGQKVTIDSASLMNKGLELIEACWLFDVSPQKIQVVVHPQSIVHSLVSFDDGSVLAQMGNPDMRTPIAHALAWPKRINSGVSALDLVEVSRLDFEAPDTRRFPCLRLACEAASAGGTATTVLNAADEVVVPAFLKGEIGFMDMATYVEDALQQTPVEPVDCIETLLETDLKTRELVKQAISRRTMAVSL